MKYEEAAWNRFERAGDSEEAPYLPQHVAATFVEREVCRGQVAVEQARRKRE